MICSKGHPAELIGARRGRVIPATVEQGPAWMPAIELCPICEEDLLRRECGELIEVKEEPVHAEG